MNPTLPISIQALDFRHTSERSTEVDMPRALIATPDLIQGKQSQEIASSSSEERDSPQ